MSLFYHAFLLVQKLFFRACLSPKTRQLRSSFALANDDCLFQRTLEALFDLVKVDTLAKEVCPVKLREGNVDLFEPTVLSCCPSKSAIRIVRHSSDVNWQQARIIVVTTELVCEIDQVVVLHELPERLLVDLAFISNDVDVNLLDAGFPASANEVMMVDEVKIAVCLYDRNAVITNILLTLLRCELLDLLDFSLDLAHAENKLTWTKL